MKRLHATIILIFLVTISVSSCLSRDKPDPEPEPFWDAIKKENLEEIKLLVSKGADINGHIYGKPRSRRYFEIAVETGNKEIIQFFLDNNVQNVSDALYESIKADNLPITELLLDNGADPNSTYKAYRPIFNHEKLSLAEKVEKIVEFSRGKFNNPGMLAYLDNTEYSYFIENLDLDVTKPVDGLKRTLLHIAANNIRPILVQLLLEDNEQLCNVQDVNGHTPLYYAITADGPMINWTNPVIESEEEAKINYDESSRLLFFPVQLRKKQQEIIEKLISKTNLNNQNKWGWTVLHFIGAKKINSRSDKSIEIWTNRGVNPELRTTMNRTAQDIRDMQK